MIDRRAEDEEGVGDLMGFLSSNFCLLMSVNLFE